jgi:tRNA pseudouridine38-40 synthase
LREAPAGASRRVWVATPTERIRPPEDGRVRLRLVVAYHGAAFHGIAPQPGLETVGGVLLDALATVLRQSGELHLVMSGRTDAGVHAWCQVLHVDVAVPPPSTRAPRDPAAVVGGIDLDRLLRSLAGLLPPTVVVRSVDIAPPTFDARFSALSRRYRYSVLNTPTGDPFLRGLVWHVREPLDLSLMRLASDAFIGDHDFASFCRAPTEDMEGATTKRVVTDARWTDTGSGVLHFEIEALAFCQQMVRSIVGFLVDVGRGKRSAGSVLETLAARDRAAAGTPAPADGLCLWDVRYPDEFPLPVLGSGWRPLP